MVLLSPHDGSPDRPAVFSDALIQFCLSIKVLFKLSLRQTAGMSPACCAWPDRTDPSQTIPPYATVGRTQLP
ncbi:transposase [Aliiruegeria haliotis]|uniref:transposase n=1 Tax=Aliiruegeria haliotis TaxID=1280846 RepID=UPI003CCB8E05